MGLINGVGSYNGEVPICFTADRDMMPDPDFYEACIDAAFTELHDAARKESANRAEKPATD